MKMLQVYELTIGVIRLFYMTEDSAIKHAKVGLQSRQPDKVDIESFSIVRVNGTIYVGCMKDEAKITLITIEIED